MVDNEKKNILIVDDEHDLCEIMSYNISVAGYNVDCAYSAEEALGMDLSKYSLILLDVMMDEMSGFDMAKIVKGNSLTEHIPIIFLTAKDTEEDLLRGFEVGADDYIEKPFSIREVLARIKAVITRSEKAIYVPKENELEHEGIELDVKKKCVHIDGQDITLTRTEFELMKLLLANKGRVLSRQQLIEGAWPDEVIVTDRTVDVNITRLRKKIGRYSANIITRLGYGYYFEP